jgi:hypothetical protein
MSLPYFASHGSLCRFTTVEGPHGCLLLMTRELAIGILPDTVNGLNRKIDEWTLTGQSCRHHGW